MKHSKGQWRNLQSHLRPRRLFVSTTIKHCGYLYQHPYGIISLRQGFLNLSSKYFERNNFTLIGNHTSFPLLTLAAFVWVWHLVDSGIYAPTTREFKALRVKKGRAGPQRKGQLPSIQLGAQRPHSGKFRTAAEGGRRQPKARPERRWA